jgi:hypothetical protein
MPFDLSTLPFDLSTLPFDLSTLPPLERAAPANTDWLVHRPVAKAAVYRHGEKEIALDNGLLRRVFRLHPNAATVGFDNRMTGEALLRSVRPEAVLSLDGVSYSVGGLTGQPDLAYLLPEWLDTMTSDPNAFRFQGYEVGKTTARFPWKKGPLSHDLPWPPPGCSLTLRFLPPEGKLPGVALALHYELYDGIPLLSKWLTLQNDGPKPLRVNRFTLETLGLVEAESIVDPTAAWRLPNLAVLTDYSFGGMSLVNSTKTVAWVPDPDYTTQVNYELKTPAVMEIHPPLGPDVDVLPGHSFESFRAFELLYDSTDRERQGLAVRRMYRTLAPWVTENPLMLHLTSTNPETAHHAMDQAAEVGFEQVIFSFGSGLNMEDTSPENVARFKAFADYAHKKGLRLGGYSLLASRSISPEDDVINPKTGKTGGAIFGNSPCLGSRWGIEYFQHIKTFLSATGFDLLEHDGSYPGDVCASKDHPGHHGLEDSQWTQYAQISDLYEWCRARDISLNVPDVYFLRGSTKTAMGYRETNWSLPRAQQHLHARQNLFDGTWEKAPSMGWMFVPLVEYHGGGKEATIEPLKDHLSDYEQHLMNNLGYGAQACYRGPRLYDSDETKAVVTKAVNFFKAHRAILESDVIHWRRADGRDVDGILHVNPDLPEKGLAIFYNPTRRAITKEIELPLYYTGLTETARISAGESAAKPYKLDREYRVKLEITVPAQGSAWYLIR